MTKGSEAPHSARIPDTAIIYATKGQVRMQEMHHSLVDTGATRAGFLQHFVNSLLVLRIDVERQRFGLGIYIGHSLI